MKTRAFIAATGLGLVAGCSSVSLSQSAPVSDGGRLHDSGNHAQRNDGIADNRNVGAMSLEQYKRLLAQHIAGINSDKIYFGNPQAMLRSVVVVKYVVDERGNLVHSATVRANGDDITISRALTSLRKSSPFPAPPQTLLSRGQLEILETMLFNDDDRFQMRSIAEAQLDE